MTASSTFASPFGRIVARVDAARDPFAPPTPSVDDAHLSAALIEAWRGVGRTHPNPAVGAIVARGDEVVGRGHHAKAGLPHAEPNALDDAGDRARGATLYVTLEPCCHHGRTPPCVDRVVASGVARVVVGCGDPNPKVDGKGVAALRAAGVVVDVRPPGDPLAIACRALIAPFAAHVVHKRPYVVLKAATTLDGRVATKTGASRFITGPKARAIVHALRDRCDAVLVGRGTVDVDDPRLDVRDSIEGGAGRPDGPPRDPLRVVLDTHLASDPKRAVYRPANADGSGGALVVSGGRPPDSRARAFADAGVPRVAVAGADDRADPRAVLAALASRGVASVLVEGGPTVASSFLAAGAVDEVWWFAAPRVLGADALPAVGPLGARAVDDGVRLDGAFAVAVDDDALFVGRPARRR